MNRVLVLGAGLVSRPLVRALAAEDDVEVTLGDQDVAKAREVLGDAPRGRAVAVSLSDLTAVRALVEGSDLVVSLLPFTLHVPVAKLAVDARRSMITTSYVSREMRALDADARAAGVLLLNEIGLDPGLDHMSAMRVIHGVRRTGGHVVGFKSCCGGLPAPESNTNPWGYKFSWSPRGVLLAGRNPARWLDGGRLVECDAAHLFDHAVPYEMPGLPPLEVYPNRDSIAYVATYGIEGVQTMFRGTLRWPGWSETLAAVARLGFLDVEERPWRAGTTLSEFSEAFAAPGTGPLRSRLAAHAGVAAAGPVLERLIWAGFLSDEPIGATSASPLDVVCRRLERTMRYDAGERDLVVLRHEIATVDARGRAGTIDATLLAYGEPGGDSAMSRTVSLPAAAAARLVLDGAIRETGVRIPVDAEIYGPVLDALEPLGIRFDERERS